MYTYQEAADFAALILYASDMNSQYYDNPTPVPDPRIEEDGWELVGYIWGNDLSVSTDPDTNKKKLFQLPTTVCYGYLAEMKGASGKYAVAIRGTDASNLMEILRDIDTQLISPWHNALEQQVHEGFFRIYNSLRFQPRELMPYRNGSSNNYNQLDLADGLADFIKLRGGSNITIMGHSLGSALASYLMYNIAPLIPHHYACLFACPRPGNQAFSLSIQENFCHGAVNYEVFNYIDDLIPHLPLEISGYSSLQNITNINTPNGVNITSGLTCNHILMSYIARLHLDKYKKIMSSKNTKIKDPCVHL
ncbi:lipase family protein [Xenorhabdus sp. 12]|uniref:Lipase family protein n=1 Tax=Xenorhabdus santafensis TaxID=2582833 RepID=A0ABU4S7K1_9GAMM|nr:lipase family protein [Xenorhabdus sp. 12]MDX7986625.1 lipase family protein [Xenorhabdus sp. 12]